MDLFDQGIVRLARLMDFFFQKHSAILYVEYMKKQFEKGEVSLFDHPIFTPSRSTATRSFFIARKWNYTTVGGMIFAAVTLLHRLFSLIL